MPPLSHLTVECRDRDNPIDSYYNDLTILEPDSKGQTDTKLTKKRFLPRNIAENELSSFDESNTQNALMNATKGRREWMWGWSRDQRFSLVSVAFQQQYKTTNSLLIGMIILLAM